MSSMSLAVSAGAVSPPPKRLMPLLFDRAPPSSTRVRISVPRTDSTRRRIRPSLSSRMTPGRNVVRQLLVVEADAFLVAELAGRVERELLARLEHDLASGELADADLRALQIGHDRDLAAQRSRCVAHHARALLDGPPRCHAKNSAARHRRRRRASASARLRNCWPDRAWPLSWCERCMDGLA